MLETETGYFLSPLFVTFTLHSFHYAKRYLTFLHFQVCFFFFKHWVAVYCLTTECLWKPYEVPGAASMSPIESRKSPEVYGIPYFSLVTIRLSQIISPVIYHILRIGPLSYFAFFHFMYLPSVSLEWTPARCVVLAVLLSCTDPAICTCKRASRM